MHEDCKSPLNKRRRKCFIFILLFVFMVIIFMVHFLLVAFLEEITVRKINRDFGVYVLV